MVKRPAIFLLISLLFLLLETSCSQAPKKKKLPGTSASEASQLPWSRPESWQGGGSRFGLPQYY